jgi:hypothetical protein
MAEREPGGLLGGADLARVGEEGRLRRAQGKLVVGALLLAQQLVGGRRLLAEAVGQVTPLDRDPPLVGAGARQHDGRGRSASRRRPAAGLGPSRPAGIARGRGRIGAFGWPLGNRDRQRRRGLESLPEGIELRVPLAGDRKRHEGAAGPGWNGCSGAARLERWRRAELASDAQRDRVGRPAPPEWRGERPIVVDGQGRGAPVGQGIRGDSHPDFTRGTGSDVHDRDEHGAAGRADQQGKRQCQEIAQAQVTPRSAAPGLSPVPTFARG